MKSRGSQSLFIVVRLAALPLFRQIFVHIADQSDGTIETKSSEVKKVADKPQKVIPPPVENDYESAVDQAESRWTFSQFMFSMKAST